MRSLAHPRDRTYARNMPARRVVLAVAVLSANLCAQARTSEKIECGAMPAAVRAAAQKQKMRQGTEAACEKITESGASLYELKVTAESGKMREIVFRPNGQIVEFENESELSQIPAAARAAIQKATLSGELLKVDVIHRGSTLLYEGEYRFQGVKKKVVVDARGRTVQN